MHDREYGAVIYKDPRFRQIPNMRSDQLQFSQNIAERLTMKPPTLCPKHSADPSVDPTNTSSSHQHRSRKDSRLTMEKQNSLISLPKDRSSLGRQSVQRSFSLKKSDEISPPRMKRLYDLFKQKKYF